MLRFESPIYFWLLAIIPVLVGIRYLMLLQRKKRLEKLGDPSLLEMMMPRMSKLRPEWKFWLLMFAIALLSVMLARPQKGSSIQHEKRNGIEIMIALDISNSMLAEDVQPSRLDKSKMLIENIIDNCKDDKIGLVVFAGDAFVQLPITRDYVSARMFLQSISPSLINMQGTDIAKAIDNCMTSFTDAPMDKAIIVITDGENHEGGAVEAAKKALDKNVHVYMLGIGKTQGAPIPMPDGSYLTDNTGETVMTALNEDMCREIAEGGKGKYIHVDNTGDAQELLNDELTRLQKGETESVIYTAYDDQFQYVGILLILILLIEVCILEAKNPLFEKISIFKRKESKK